MTAKRPNLWMPELSASLRPYEQWQSILRRKRLRHPSFADVPALARAVREFIREWNEIAHPFGWTTKSFEKSLATAEAAFTGTSTTLPKAA